jgi:hypothetical protein
VKVTFDATQISHQFGNDFFERKSMYLMTRNVRIADEKTVPR